MALVPAVFLDRDGTIIEDKHYLNTPELIRYVDGIREGLELLFKHGFELFIVSNQSGVGRGYFGFNMMRRINRHIELDLQSWGISVLDSEYCPHHPNERCGCRKPGTFMFQRIFDRHTELSRKCSFMIGDSARDMEAAGHVGLKRVMLTKHPPSIEVEFWTRNFHKAANWILNYARSNCPEMLRAIRF